MTSTGASRKNLITVGIVAGLFLAIVAAGVIGNLRRGNYVVLPIVFTALAICGVAIWISHFRIRVLLRDRTPDRMIAHYHRSVRRIPNAEAAAAYLSSMTAVFFGQFDRAREELKSVDWAQAPAEYQGHRLYVLAVLAILEANDYPQALDLARQARELDNFPLLDDIVTIVANGAAPERLERLEKTARKQQGLIPGMCAWALAVHYKRGNQPDRAGEFKAILRLSMPYCAPLAPRSDVDRPDISVTGVN